ncbi:putative ABC transport system permease protein [Microbacterium resistens]|uniref:ABC transport system permease protein n=1 Tax=Microbacterium resistens TaxID=156977 RepID=A0ABU1S7U8_9MICO|nr:ABC transporter permease [Microbacterium resistens]MDR6865671.1 putative ABC transport system permease protein [Microbacterium resistens]
MSALNRRIWRMLREHLGRYIGIAVLVLLGSFYFTAATGVAGSMERTVVGFADGNQQEDLSFTTDKPLDIAEWEGESGATIEAAPRHDVRLPEGELRLLSPGPTLNLAQVTSGRALADPGDLLVDPHFLGARGLRIGDTLTLDGLGFTIVGTVAVPNYVYPLKGLYDVLPTAGFGIGVVAQTDLQALSPAVETSTTTYSVRFHDREGIEAQTAALRNMLGDEGHHLTEWIDAEHNQRISMPWGNISSMKSMSFPVAIAFFILGCVIVSVMITRTVKADSVIAGSLYALGYRRGELTRHYLAVPVLVALAGSLVGTLLALPCVAPVIGTMLASYNLPDTGLTFAPHNLAISLLAPVALIGAASALLIRRVLRKSAADLMKGGEKTGKVTALERVLRLDRFRFVTAFRIREQVRSIPRLLFLVFGVAAASMVMLFGLTYSHSMDIVTERGALTRYEYQIEYNFTDVQNLKDSAVPDGAEPYNTIRVHPEGREGIGFYLTGMLPDSVGMKLNDTRGSPPPRNQVNITEPLATRLHLEVGDTLRFVSQLDGASYALRIDGIVQAYGEQFVTMPLEEFNRLTDQPAGSYRTVLASREMDFDESVLAGVLDTRDPGAFEQIGAPTSQIMGSVSALAVLIAVVILFLVTSLIIEENHGTVALFTVLGYRRRELARLILNSATPAVVIGILLGYPLMLAFANLLFGIVADTLNMLIPITVDPWHVLISFVVIFVVYEITKWLSGRRLAKIAMSDALKGAE